MHGFETSGLVFLRSIALLRCPRAFLVFGCDQSGPPRDSTSFLRLELISTTGRINLFGDADLATVLLETRTPEHLIREIWLPALLVAAAVLCDDPADYEAGQKQKTKRPNPGTACGTA